MKWCSIDPSNRSGIAYWDGEKLLRTAVLRRVGRNGKYAINSEKFDTRWIAWNYALLDQQQAIIEEGFGRFATAIKSQASIRGYIDAVCEYRSNKGFNTEFHVINVNEWRRVIGEEFKASWPATTERKKELSVSLVKRRYDIDVSDDEADAVLLGLAAMRMMIVDISK